MRKKLLIIFLCYLFFITTKAQDTIHKPLVGLVLSGGGAKGLAHIGVLKVIEKAGIHIDYIAGTSMGAIIGGLYAMGYPADTIEKIIRNEDWNLLLEDKPRRRQLSIDEKEDQDKYFVAFPVSARKIKLPSGVVLGQNIFNLLSKLSFPVIGIEDFSKFNTPFFCNACDLITGESVLLEKGYLPDAMRASMAIPTIFTPVEIDGHLFIDGGIVNNFLVSDIKKKNVDVIIGSFTGHNLYQKEELGSMFKILTQSLFFYSSSKNSQNMAMCDIFIEPDLKNFNITQFTRYDSLIMQGEKAAMKVYPKLKALADSIKNKDPEQKKKNLSLDFKKPVYIKELKIIGLNEVSERLLLAKLKLDFPGDITADDLDEAIQRLYGTRYFEKVTYKIESMDEGYRLLIRVEENNESQFRLGIHSDMDQKSLILMNFETRNKILHGSKFSFDAGLGQNPRYDIRYLVNITWRPDISIGLQSTGRFYNIQTYEDITKEDISKTEYFNQTAELFMQWTLDNSYSFGVGFQWQYYIQKESVDFFRLNEKGNNFLNYYGFIKWDMLDHAYYPTKGFSLYSEIRFINHTGSPSDFNMANTHIYENFLKPFSLTKKWTILFKQYLSLTTGDSVPAPYKAYLGGLGNYEQPILPFMGYQYESLVGNIAGVVRMDIQYEFRKNNFLIAKANIGDMVQDYKKYTEGKKYSGYALTYGYNSLIGPVELSVMTSDFKMVMFYFNLGFWF